MTAAPVAQDDLFSTQYLASVSGNVLSNDSDEDSDPLSAVLGNGVSYGSLSFDASGAFTYTPSTGFSGTDSFTYQASDGTELSAFATVTITVSANNLPVAQSDSYGVDAGQTLNVSAPGVLSNDSDPDGNPLFASLVSGPSYGSLVLNADGSLSYTPNGSFHGTDNFTYQASDGTGFSASATVTITVNEVIEINDPPTAVNDVYTVSTWHSVSGNVLGNDSDPEGSTLTAALLSGPMYGTLVFNTDGTFSYSPSGSFTGSDSFSYEASDGVQASSFATVNIEVHANAAPVAGNDNYTMEAFATLTVSAPGILANDTDAEGDSLTIVIVNNPMNGSLTWNADGSFSYTAYSAGTSDSFSYQLSDGVDTSNTATVTININALPEVNYPPTAYDDSYSLSQGGTLTGNVVDNDTDPENAPLTASLVSGPSYGSLFLNADGSFSYTPNAGFSGTDSFSYQAVDSSSNASGTATVTITVTDPPPPTNLAPSAYDDSNSVWRGESVTGNVLPNDTDPENDSLTASLVSGPNYGSLTFNADGSYGYAAPSWFTGTDSFTYQAVDSYSNISNTATVTISINEPDPPPSNESPTAYDDSNSVWRGESVAGNVLPNDSDPENDSLTASLVSGPNYGSLTFNADGSYSYTAPSWFTGTDSFAYQAIDSYSNTSNTATVTISVGEPPANQPPAAYDDSYGTLRDQALTGNFLTNDTDPENDSLSANLFSGPSYGTLSLSSDGSFSYLPNSGFTGTDSFTYQAVDSSSNNSNVATVSIEVIAPAPLIQVTVDGWLPISNGGTLNLGNTLQYVAKVRTLTITNNGTADLYVADGQTSAGFSLPSGFMNSTLAPGQSMNVEVQLDASELGSISGTFSVTTNQDGANPFSFQLAGVVTEYTAPELRVYLSDGASVIGGQTIAFGTTHVGIPLVRGFVVENVGNATLLLGPLSPPPPGFSLSFGTLPSTLAPGETAVFDVQLDAETVAILGGQLSFTSDDPEQGDFTINLSGEVAAATAMIGVASGGLQLVNSASTIAFERTTVGADVRRDVVIYNRGTAPLGLTTVTVPSGYEWLAPLSTSIAPGQSVVGTVVLHATDSGTPSGELVISTDDPLTPQFHVTLSGHVDDDVAQIRVAAGGVYLANGQATLTWAPTIQGTPTTRTVTIINQGRLELSLEAPIMPEGYVVVSGFQSLLAPGQSMSLVLALDANAAGTATGDISFAYQVDGEPAETFTFHAIGEVRAAGPDVQVFRGATALSDTSVVALGKTPLGTPVIAEFTILNRGSATLELTPQDLPAGSGFELISSLPTSIAAGMSATIQVRMTADAVGTRASQVTLMTNDPDQGSFTFGITGEVVVALPALVVRAGGLALSNGATVALGTVATGASATLTFSIENRGFALLALNRNLLDLPPGFSLVSPFDAVLAPGARSSFTVRLDTSTTGPKNGTISFLTNDPTAQAFSVHVSGTVNDPAPVVRLLDAQRELLSGTSEVSLGQTVVGTTVSRTFTIANRGLAPMVVESITLPDGFQVTPTAVGTINPGNFSTFVVQFAAEVVGVASGAATITVATIPNGTGETLRREFSVTFSAEAVSAAPELRVESGGVALVSGAGFVTFGTTIPGPPVPREVTIRNTGHSALALEDIVVPDGFELVTLLPATLAAGESLSLTLTLTATGIGNHTGLLRLLTDDPQHGEFDVQLAGVVTASTAQLRVSHGVMRLESDSSEVALGTTLLDIDRLQTFTLRNTGTEVMTLSVDPTSSGQIFEIVSTLPATLDPGDSAALTIRFNADQIGSFEDVIQIHTNDPENEHFTFAIRGSVVLPRPELQVSRGATRLSGAASTISFGSAVHDDLGQPAAITLTLFNRGTDNLTFDANTWTIVDDEDSVFTLDLPDLGALAPGESTTLTVLMDRAEVGSFSGRVSLLFSDASQPPFEFDIVGEVVEPEPDLRVLKGITTLANGSSSVAFGTTLQGAPVTQTFTILNRGTADLVLTPGMLSLPAGFSLVGRMPSRIAAGSSAQFTIQLDALITDEYSGELRFESNHNMEWLDESYEVNGFDVNPYTVSQGYWQPGYNVNRYQIPVGHWQPGYDVGSYWVQQGHWQPGYDVPRYFVSVGYYQNGFDVNGYTDGEGNWIEPFWVAGEQADPAWVNGSTPNPHWIDTGSYWVEAFWSPGTTIDPAWPTSTYHEKWIDTSYWTTPFWSEGETVDPAWGTAATYSPHWIDTGSYWVEAFWSPGTIIDPAWTAGVSYQEQWIDTSYQAGGMWIAADSPDPAWTNGYTHNPHLIEEGHFAGVFTISISGQVSAPAPLLRASVAGIALSAASLVDFGTTTTGTPATRTITIANRGTQDLILDLDSLVLPTGFERANSPLTTVAPGSSTTLLLRMSAAVAGQFGGEVVLETGDPAAEPLRFFVQGTVAPPVARLEATIGDRDIGTGDRIVLGRIAASTTPSWTITIRNRGAAELVINAAEIVGAGGFTLSSVPSSGFAPGSSVDLVLGLDAATNGKLAGKVKLFTNDPTHAEFIIDFEAEVVTPQAELHLYAGATELSMGPESEWDWGLFSQVQTVQRTLRIVNTGLAALTITPGSLQLSAGLSVQGEMPTSIAAGGSALVQLVLAAPALGDFSGEVTFETNDPTAPSVEINLRGRIVAPTPKIEVASESLLLNGTNFGVAFGESRLATTVVKQITLTNVGGADLLISNVAPPIGFSLVAGAFVPATLAMGASITLGIKLDAAAAGTFGGNLVITSNDTEHETLSVVMTGTVVAVEGPAVVADVGGEAIFAGVGTVDFGDTLVGSIVTREFRFTNVGSETIKLTNATVTAGFAINNSPAVPTTITLTPGSSALIAVRMSAAAASSAEGTFSVTMRDVDNEPIEVLDFDLRGEVRQVVSQRLRLYDGANAIGTNPIDFGSVTQGSTATRSFVLYNEGPQAVAFDSNSLTLPLGQGFSLVGALPTTLGTNSAVTLTIRFDTTTVDSFAGLATLQGITVGANPSNVLFQFSLAGEVQAAPDNIAVRSGGVDLVSGQSTLVFGLTGLGAPITRTLEVVNRGLAPIDISNISISDVSGSARFTVDPLSQTTLAAGASATLTVRLDAAIVGDFTGLLLLEFDGQTISTFEIELVGEVEERQSQVGVIAGIVGVASGDTLQLGTVVAGSAFATALTVFNAGNADLILSNITPPAGLTVEFSGPTTLAPGHSVTLSLSAAVAGTYAGNLTFTTNDPDQPSFTVHVEGVVQVAPPGIRVTLEGGSLVHDIPDGQFGEIEVDFGVVQSGVPYEREFTIRNIGGTPLVLSGFSAPPGFSIIAPTTLTIAANATTKFKVTFDEELASGVDEEAFSGEVTFTASAAGYSPITFNFLVAGTLVDDAAQITITDDDDNLLVSAESSLEFDVTERLTPVSKFLSVTNSGEADLRILSWDAPAGLLVLPSTLVIAAGETATIEVQLAAIELGHVFGDLVLHTNAQTTSEFTISVSGEVVPIPARFSLLDNSGAPLPAGSDTVTFGPVELGSPSPTISVTIQYIGDSAVTLYPSSLNLPAGFYLAGASGDVDLQSGASFSLTLGMSTTTAGEYSGTVSLPTSLNQGSVFSYSVAGSVFDPSDPPNDPPATEVYVALTSDTGVSSDDLITKDPRLTITLTGEFVDRGDLGGWTKVEFNQSGVLSEVEQPFNSSTFQYDPRDLNPALQAGPVTVLVRASRFGEYGGLIVSSTWQSFTFELVPPAPEIALVDANGHEIAAGGNVIYFDTTDSNTPWSRTFSVHNRGDAPLNLNSLSLPTGFALQSGYPTSIGAGGSGSFTVLLASNTGGSGSISLGSNDPTRPTFQFALTVSDELVPNAVDFHSDLGDVTQGASTTSTAAQTSYDNHSSTANSAVTANINAAQQILNAQVTSGTNSSQLISQHEQSLDEADEQLIGATTAAGSSLDAALDGHAQTTAAERAAAAADYASRVTSASELLVTALGSVATGDPTAQVIVAAMDSALNTAAGLREDAGDEAVLLHSGATNTAAVLVSAAASASVAAFAEQLGMASERFASELASGRDAYFTALGGIQSTFESTLGSGLGTPRQLHEEFRNELANARDDAKTAADAQSQSIGDKILGAFVEAAGVGADALLAMASTGAPPNNGGSSSGTPNEGALEAAQSNASNAAINAADAKEAAMKSALEELSGNGDTLRQEAEGVLTSDDIRNELDAHVEEIESDISDAVNAGQAAARKDASEKLSDGTALTSPLIAQLGGSLDALAGPAVDGQGNVNAAVALLSGNADTALSTLLGTVVGDGSPISTSSFGAGVQVEAPGAATSGITLADLHSAQQLVTYALPGLVLDFEPGQLRGDAGYRPLVPQLTDLALPILGFSPVTGIAGSLYSTTFTILETGTIEHGTFSLSQSVFVSIESTTTGTAALGEFSISVHYAVTSFRYEEHGTLHETSTLPDTQYGVLTTTTTRKDSTYELVAQGSWGVVVTAVGTYSQTGSGMQIAADFGVQQAGAYQHAYTENGTRNVDAESSLAPDSEEGGQLGSTGAFAGQHQTLTTFQQEEIGNYGFQASYVGHYDVTPSSSGHATTLLVATVDADAGSDLDFTVISEGNGTSLQNADNSSSSSLGAPSGGASLGVARQLEGQNHSVGNESGNSGFRLTQSGDYTISSGVVADDNNGLTAVSTEIGFTGDALLTQHRSSSSQLATDSELTGLDIQAMTSSNDPGAVVDPSTFQSLGDSTESKQGEEAAERNFLRRDQGSFSIEIERLEVQNQNNEATLTIETRVTTSSVDFATSESITTPYSSSSTSVTQNSQSDAFSDSDSTGSREQQTSSSFQQSVTTSTSGLRSYQNLEAGSTQRQQTAVTVSEASSLAPVLAVTTTVVQTVGAFLRSQTDQSTSDEECEETYSTQTSSSSLSTQGSHVASDVSNSNRQSHTLRTTHATALQEVVDAAQYGTRAVTLESLGQDTQHSTTTSVVGNFYQGQTSDSSSVNLHDETYVEYELHIRSEPLPAASSDTSDGSGSAEAATPDVLTTSSSNSRNGHSEQTDQSASHARATSFGSYQQSEARLATRDAASSASSAGSTTESVQLLRTNVSESHTSIGEQSGESSSLLTASGHYRDTQSRGINMTSAEETPARGSFDSETWDGTFERTDNTRSTSASTSTGQGTLQASSIQFASPLSEGEGTSSPTNLTSRTTTSAGSTFSTQDSPQADNWAEYHEKGKHDTDSVSRYTTPTVEDSPSQTIYTSHNSDKRTGTYKLDDSSWSSSHSTDASTYTSQSQSVGLGGSVLYASATSHGDSASRSRSDSGANRDYTETGSLDIEEHDSSSANYGPYTNTDREQRGHYTGPAEGTSPSPGSATWSDADWLAPLDESAPLDAPSSGPQGYRVKEHSGSSSTAERAMSSTQDSTSRQVIGMSFGESEQTSESVSTGLNTTEETSSSIIRGTFKDEFKSRQNQSLGDPGDTTERKTEGKFLQTDSDNAYTVRRQAARSETGSRVSTLGSSQEFEQSSESLDAGWQHESELEKHGTSSFGKFKEVEKDGDRTTTTEYKSVKKDNSEDKSFTADYSVTSSQAESLTAGDMLVRQSRDWETEGMHVSQQSGSTNSHSEDGVGKRYEDETEEQAERLGKIDVISPTEDRKSKFSRIDESGNSWQSAETEAFHETGKDRASGDHPATTRSNRQSEGLSYWQNNDSTLHVYAENGTAKLNSAGLTTSPGETNIESYASDSQFGSTNRDTSNTASTELVTFTSHTTVDARGDMVRRTLATERDGKTSDLDKSETHHKDWDGGTFKNELDGDTSEGKFRLDNTADLTWTTLVSGTYYENDKTIRQENVADSLGESDSAEDGAPAEPSGKLVFEHSLRTSDTDAFDKFTVKETTKYRADGTLKQAGEPDHKFRRQQDTESKLETADVNNEVTTSKSLDQGQVHLSLYSSEITAGDRYQTATDKATTTYTEWVGAGGGSTAEPPVPPEAEGSPWSSSSSSSTAELPYFAWQREKAEYTGFDLGHYTSKFKSGDNNGHTFDSSERTENGKRYSDDQKSEAFRYELHDQTHDDDPAIPLGQTTDRIESNVQSDRTSDKGTYETKQESFDDDGKVKQKFEHRKDDGRRITEAKNEHHVAEEAKIGDDGETVPWSSEFGYAFTVGLPVNHPDVLSGPDWQVSDARRIATDEVFHRLGQADYSDSRDKLEANQRTQEFNVSTTTDKSAELQTETSTARLVNKAIETVSASEDYSASNQAYETTANAREKTSHGLKADSTFVDKQFALGSHDDQTNQDVLKQFRLTSATVTGDTLDHRETHRDVKGSAHGETDVETWRNGGTVTHDFNSDNSGHFTDNTRSAMSPWLTAEVAVYRQDNKDQQHEQVVAYGGESRTQSDDYGWVRVTTGWHNETTADSAGVTWDGDKRFKLGDLVGTNEDTGRDYFSSYDGHFFSTDERTSRFDGTPDSTRNTSHTTHELTQRANSHNGYSTSVWTRPLGNGSTGSVTDEGTHHQETTDNVTFDNVTLVNGPDSMLDVTLPEGGPWTVKGTVTAKGSTDTHTVETGWYRNGEFSENYNLSVNSVRDDSASTRSTGSGGAWQRHDSASHLTAQTQNVGQISSAAGASGTVTTNQTHHRWSADKAVTVNKTVEGASLAYGEGSLTTGYGQSSGTGTSTGQRFVFEVQVTTPSVEESDTYLIRFSSDTPPIFWHASLSQPTLLVGFWPALNGGGIVNHWPVAWQSPVLATAWSPDLATGLHSSFTAAIPNLLTTNLPHLQASTPLSGVPGGQSHARPADGDYGDTSPGPNPVVSGDGSTTVPWQTLPNVVPAGHAPGTPIVPPALPGQAGHSAGSSVTPALDFLSGKPGFQITQFSNDALHEVCFAAGTLVVTRTGLKPIETIEAGECVLAAHHDDPEGRLYWMRVEKAYHNAPRGLINLHVAGKVLRVTHNHPIYVVGEGFTPAAQLKRGDELRTVDGSVASVEDLFDNGEIEPVYNLRVADGHTYFVATSPTGPAVLVHNESPGSQPNNGTSEPANPPSITTKTHLPSDARGAWIEGTKGNGVFQYADTAENRAAGIVGKKIHFRDNYIAIGGFPAEYYYGGSAKTASVEISTVTGKRTDGTAADAEMRKIRKDPNWKRPPGYEWNHAGPPGSKTMELVDQRIHDPVAHKGSASLFRATARAAKSAQSTKPVSPPSAPTPSMHETPQAGKPTKSPSSGGGIGRVLVVADVYLTMRDAMQATGLLQPTYVVTDEFDYYFVADDNSVFVVREQDFWSPFKRVFISGPRAGQEEPIMRPEADMYQRTAEAIWGRYIKGTLFEGPRFIPGTERKYIDYTETRDGVEYKAGYIDEHGIHRFPQGLQRPILQ